MTTHLTAQGIADLIGKTRRTIQRQAMQGDWPYIEENGRGGAVRKYEISKLPVEIRLLYNKDRSKSMTKPTEGSLVPRPIIVCPELAGWQNRIASARFDLVSDVVKAKEALRAKKNRAKNKKQFSITAAAIDFVAAYNTGLTHPETFAVLGKVSKSTLDTWHVALKKNQFDFSALAPRHGEHRKGKRKVTEAEMEQMLRFALTPNQLRVAQAIRWTKKTLAKEGTPSPSSEATLRRSLLDWKSQNFDRWTFCRKGEKALDDEVLPYLERDASLLEVGDVLVADGHKLNFQVINPFTGKPGRAVWLVFYDWASRYPAGWTIMFTENIQCVHAALRRALLNLGKLPLWVLLDNGKAFKAKVFTDTMPDFEQLGFRGMYARLGIQTCFAAPYNAKAKVVERFFGTFNELERLLPSYTGASIQDKPAHMKRNEKLHKKLHNPFVPTIEQAETIISAWITDEYAMRSHRGLKGACPGDLWSAGKGPGVDEAGLRYLMMTHEVKAIHRNGITMFGVNYYDEALYGYRQPVTVRYDILDMDQIYVYTAGGKGLLCEARPVQKTHPMARMSDNPLDLETMREAIRKKKKLKRSTEAEARQMATEIGPWNFPEVKEQERPLTRAEIEKIEADAANTKVISITERAEPELALWDGDTYEKLLIDRARGEVLTTDQMVMMNAFEQTKEYRMLEPYYRQVEEDALLEQEAAQ